MTELQADQKALEAFLLDNIFEAISAMPKKWPRREWGRGTKDAQSRHPQKRPQDLFD